MSIEEQFNATFKELDYTKDIEYNFEPFYNCIKDILKPNRFIYDSDYVILKILQDNNISREKCSFIQKISFFDIDNSCFKPLLEEVWYYKETRLIYIVFDKVVSFERSLFKIYLVLNSLKKHDKGDIINEYKTVENFFNSLKPCFFDESESDIVYQHRDKSKIQKILSKWYNTHADAFKKVIYQKKNVQKTHKHDINRD
ncbi:hypothetical protein CDIK_3870 [Cucumispora dikerogammari]|nr:hypothetical protein CDIK_3870 [Cucumispora dikerogammari]